MHEAASNEVDASGAIRMLVAAGSEGDVPDKDGMTPLHWAAWRGHDEVVTILLDAGADANKRTTATTSYCESGWTPADLAKHGGALSVDVRLREGRQHPALAKKLQARERHGLFGLRRRIG